MTQCAPGWEKGIFENVRRVRSNFSGKTSEYPSHLRSFTSKGRTDFEAWAELPKITYAARPEDLYRMDQLRQRLEDSDCFTKSVVEKQSAQGVNYPTSFYAGLILAGVAVVYSLR